MQPLLKVALSALQWVLCAMKTCWVSRKRKTLHLYLPPDIAIITAAAEHIDARIFLLEEINKNLRCQCFCISASTWCHTSTLLIPSATVLECNSISAEKRIKKSWHDSMALKYLKHNSSCYNRSEIILTYSCSDADNFQVSKSAAGIQQLLVSPQC